MAVQLQHDDARRVIRRNGVRRDLIARPGREEAPGRRRGPSFWVALAVGWLLVLATVAAGAFFVGQTTRPSSDEVDARVASQSAADKRFFAIKMDVALEAQDRHLASVMERRLRKASEKAFVKGRSQGYAAGRAQGFAAGRAQGLAAGQERARAVGRHEGRAQGVVDGYRQGFEKGTCYEPVTYDFVC
jgi:flagellar biosynthesis/type III secretory pathway protein FliH